MCSWGSPGDAEARLAANAELSVRPKFKVISHVCASHSGTGGSVGRDVRPGNFGDSILVMTSVVIGLGKIEAVKSKGLLRVSHIQIPILEHTRRIPR